MVSYFLRRTEENDEMAFGQIVIIWARWILVAAGLLLTAWNPGEMEDLRVSFGLIITLAAGNFFLHTQLVSRGPALTAVTYAASVADLAVISLIIGVGSASAFVFYVPALLAISVAFPTPATALYTTGAILTYGGIAASQEAAAPTLLVQLMALAAVSLCGNLYWRVERRRRGEDAPTGMVEPEAVEEPIPAPSRSLARTTRKVAGPAPQERSGLESIAPSTGPYFP